MAAVPLAFTRGGEPRHPTGKSEAAIPADWRLAAVGADPAEFPVFLGVRSAASACRTFPVVALGAIHGTSLVTANTALSGYLLMSAFGVLVGGCLAANIGNHRLIAAVGLGATVLAVLLIARIDLGSILLVAVMSLSGLCSGAVMPSRDMIVREVTPPGSFGTVFAFVTTGYHIAGILAPLLFGALLDHGAPRSIFFTTAAFALISIFLVVIVPRRRAA